MTLPIDPDADASRRAWLRCPHCEQGVGCPDCENNRNCASHWQYLLSNQGRLVYLQCPACTWLWSCDPILRRGPARKAA